MSIYKIQFSATCHTVPGQFVYICGNVTELGNWCPQKSLRLYTDDSLYPKWNSYQTIKIRQGSKLLFKLCIIKDQTSIRWQKLQGNRQILPTSHNYVQFTQGDSQLIFTPMPDIEIKPPRKKTKDILNEMDSDGASSKQYWKQFMEQQQNVLFVTLTNNMRKLIQSQNALSFAQISKKSSFIMETNKQENNIQQQLKYQICSNIFFIKKDSIQEKSFNSKIHWVKEETLKNFRIHNSKDCNLFFIQSHLSKLEKNIQNINKIMHLQDLIMNNSKEKIIKQIPYFLIYQMTEHPQIKHIKTIVNYKISAIVIINELILNLVIEHSIFLGYQIRITGQNELIVKLPHSRQLRLILRKSQNQKRQKSVQMQKQQSQQLAEYLQNLVLNEIKHSNFRTLDTFQTQIKDESLFRNFQYNKKIIIILQVVSLQKLTMKVITQLISLSSKNKIEVYIICSQKFKDLQQRFPLSDKDKIVFLNYDGYLYSNSSKNIDLFNNLCMPKQKFQQNIEKIEKQINFGIVTKIKTQNGYMFNFSKNYLGKVAKELLISRIFELNQKQIFKLCWKQYQNIIEVIPFCISQEFYYQSILYNLSKFTPEQSCLVLNINFKQDNKCFSTCEQKLKLNQGILCNYKVKNYQVVDSSQKGFFQFQSITSQMAEYLFQYMNEHILAGSSIKAYHPIVFQANNGNLRRSLRPNMFVHHQQSHQQSIIKQ